MILSFEVLKLRAIGLRVLADISITPYCSIWVSGTLPVPDSQVSHISRWDTEFCGFVFPRKTVPHREGPQIAGFDCIRVRLFQAPGLMPAELAWSALTIAEESLMSVLGILTLDPE